MILYHAISTYQLLEMMLFRLKNSKIDDSILMITDTLRDKFPEIVKNTDFFSDVWVYDINLNFPPKKSYEKVVNEYFNDFFSNKNVKITDFEKIYLSCAHYFFGHYLVINNLKFVFFEDAAGMLSRPDILINIEKDSRPFKCKKNIDMGLYDGSASCIEEIVCNFSAQSQEIIQSYQKLRNFNVVKELIELDDEKKNKILAFFLKNYNRIDIAQKTSILLTQHFANLKIMSFKEQETIYKWFVDYFLEDKYILIKPHPDDVMYYKKILNNVDIIKERFPSEFLPLLINDNVEEIVTISSTAIANYYECDYSILEMNTDFEKTFYSLHKYYVALRLAKIFNKSISMIGCDESLIRKLIERRGELQSINVSDSGEILLIDDYSNLRFSVSNYTYNEECLMNIQNKICNLDNDQVLIFLNSKCNYSFFYRDISVFDNLYPINIKIEDNGKKELWEAPENIDKNQLIYVYTKNENYINLLKEFKMNQNLNNSNLEIKVDGLDEYQKNIYEGKIKSLEERLMYYMELCYKLSKDENN